MVDFKINLDLRFGFALQALTVATFQVPHHPIPLEFFGWLGSEGVYKKLNVNLVPAFINVPCCSCLIIMKLTTISMNTTWCVSGMKPLDSVEGFWLHCNSDTHDNILVHQWIDGSCWVWSAGKEGKCSSLRRVLGSTSEWSVSFRNLLQQ